MHHAHGLPHGQLELPLARLGCLELLDWPHARTALARRSAPPAAVCLRRAHAVREVASHWGRWPLRVCDVQDTRRSGRSRRAQGTGGCGAPPRWRSQRKRPPARARAPSAARHAERNTHLDQRGVVAQLVDGRAHGVPRARVGVPLRPRSRRPPARLQLAVGRAARGLLRGRRRVRRLAREDLQRPRARRAPAAMSSAHHGGRAPCQGGERCLPAHAAQRCTECCQCSKCLHSDEHFLKKEKKQVR